MALSSAQIILLCAVGIVLLARPAHAFGAGNIGSTSKIEGQNWRHGDLEDTLLTIVASRAMGGKKFSKLDVKRVYFGNWLRDYSQAVDVGTVKSVSAEAIRIVLWVLGFLSFGYGSGEFEVTTERLGCYRPEEHIDNPKDYADNVDARQYDRRLRGPVDERRELSINDQTGLKNYIASEGMGIDTSAGLVRKLFGQSIDLGRRYARSKNKKDLYEALRLLGTGSHCLEDFAAHSNYVELALIEMGERDVFPHVGRNTAVRLRDTRNPVFPIVTGTFGGVDFLHSVCGEFDDKTTQSEIEELQGTMMQYQNGRQDNSLMQQLLDKVPSGVFGSKDEKRKADELKQNAINHQMQNSRISPRKPEEWTRYVNDVQKQILPIIQWHDEVLQSITETIEKIPILPDLIDQIQDEVNKFVFSLLAPYVVPLINQVKTELNTGSNEIIQSSKDKQHIVFRDDNSSDPTHSMLSKDHFSNILNEPAGKVARQTVRWVVPQIVACWDDEHIDVNRTLNRIIQGVLHHPALRDRGDDGAGDGRKQMFDVVREWWGSKSDREKGGLRDQLSRRGVESGKNHKPGVQDHGHGSNRPLGMASVHSRADGGTSSIGAMAGAAVGGGVLGSLVGGLASGLGGDLLGGGLDSNRQTYQGESHGRNGSRTETVTQFGQSMSGDRYGQAQYSRTTEVGGGQSQQYSRFEQIQSSGGWQSEVHHEKRTSEGRYREDTRRYGNDGDNDDEPESYGGGSQRYETPSMGYSQPDDYGRPPPRQDSYGSSIRHDDDSDRHGSHHRKRDDDDEYGGQRRREDDGDDEYRGGNRRGGDYDESDSRSGYGRQQERSSYGEGGYGCQEESGYGSGYGCPQDEPSSSYGHPEQSGYESGYGRQQDEPASGYGAGGRFESQQYSGQSYGGRGIDEYPGSREADGYGGGAFESQQSYGRSYGGRQEDEYGGDEQTGYGGDENDEYGRRRGGDDEGGNDGYGGEYSRY